DSKTVEVGHLQVEQRDVRMELGGLRKRLLAALGKAHVIAFAPQKNAQDHHRITVGTGDETADRFVGFCCHARWTRIVPWSASDGGKTLIPYVSSSDTSR